MPNADAERILDKALELAETSGWERLRLHQVAEALGIGLDEVGRHYREKEDLVEAWFDRADRAMLVSASRPELQSMSRTERLEHLIMTWLEALAAHQRVTREMILNKLEPGHLHIQIPAVMRISRTVQWIRETAGCNASFLRRALEEVALTGIYLATFATWLWDHSPGFERTRRRLHDLLAGTERISPFRCGPITSEATTREAMPSAPAAAGEERPA